MPEETSASTPMKRRDFLNWLIGGSVIATVVGVGSSMLSYLWPTKAATTKGVGTERTEVGAAGDIPEGKGKIVVHQDQPVIVIHTKEGFAAFSAACTHVACLVTWDETKQQIFCPCHGAYFDTKGNVLAGPPPRPLPAFTVTVVNDKIYIGGA